MVYLGAAYTRDRAFGRIPGIPGSRVYMQPGYTRVPYPGPGFTWATGVPVVSSVVAVVVAVGVVVDAVILDSDQ